jgi:aspartate carbamoyltransferase catalytic subunit
MSRLEHVISTKQFMDTKLLDEIFDLADRMERDTKEGRLPQTMKGKVMASVFYEPSTRTRFSFETAMQRLGGGVVMTEAAPMFSSAAKGETLSDAIKIISGYSDVIVLRHPEKGSAKVASEASDVPVLNAGDGTGEHPTQALLDMYTIRKELGRVDGLKVALVGDLRNGRTVHSLINLLALYKDVKVFLVSPAQLRLPDEYRQYMGERGMKSEELDDVSSILGQIDVMYVTRIQKERFADPAEYEKLKGSYVVDNAMLSKMKEHSIIMHPLPRVGEIAIEVDGDRRAAYFRQAKNGMYIRMVLLQMVLEK